MPAMPIAESRPPIVVGIRQTSSAANAVTVTGAPCPASFTAKIENGSSVTVASRKMIVRAASRMLSAISFGVFCRLAPSTIAIMRSRKVSPGSLLIRTTSQSDSTRVPPVTALRSPPASRMTGALSPVIALSSTEATPTTISPSLGMKSPASTSTRSPLRSSALVTRVATSPSPGRTRRCSAARSSRFATMSRRALAQRVGLRLAAPLGHRLGEVREQHREPEPERDREDEARRRLALPDQRLDEEHRGEDAADEDDEHHRVPDLVARIELPERVDQRAAHDLGIEQRSRLGVSTDRSSNS